jgi:hypothetical protein
MRHSFSFNRDSLMVEERAAITRASQVMTASVRVVTQMMVSTQMTTSRMPPLVTRTFLRMTVVKVRRARRISEER